MNPASISIFRRTEVQAAAQHDDLDPLDREVAREPAEIEGEQREMIRGPKKERESKARKANVLFSVNYLTGRYSDNGFGNDG